MKSFTRDWFDAYPGPIESEEVSVGSGYYDQDYFTTPNVKGWYDRGSFDISNEFHRMWAKFCFNMLEMKPGEKVLDVGCALGNVVYWLREDYGIDAWGFDISRWAIENSHVKDRVCEGDATKTWPVSTRFDHIICRETAEHLPQESVVEFLKQFGEHLQPGGNRSLFTFATNRANKEVKKRESEPDPSHVTIAPIDWWNKQVKRSSVVSGMRVDYERTLFAISQPVCQLYDWDMLILTKE